MPRFGPPVSSGYATWGDDEDLVYPQAGMYVFSGAFAIASRWGFTTLSYSGFSVPPPATTGQEWVVIADGTPSLPGKPMTMLWDGDFYGGGVGGWVQPSYSNITHQYWWNQIAAENPGRLYLGYSPDSFAIDPVPVSTSAFDWSVAYLPLTPHGGWFYFIAKTASSGAHTGVYRYYQEGELDLGVPGLGWFWSGDDVTAYFTPPPSGFTKPKQMPWVSYGDTLLGMSTTSQTVQIMRQSTAGSLDHVRMWPSYQAFGANGWRPDLSSGTASSMDPTGTFMDVSVFSLPFFEAVDIPVSSTFANEFSTGLANAWTFQGLTSGGTPVTVGLEFPALATDTPIGQWWPRRGRQASTAGGYPNPSEGQPWPRGNK